MEKIKSAFTLLYLLSLCDHHVSDAEIKIIKDWLQSTFSHPFYPTSVIKELIFLSPMGQRLEFYSAAFTFKKLTDISERLDFFRSAVKLIYADDQLQPTEQLLIESLAQWWNIDLPTFLSTDLEPVFDYSSPFSSVSSSIQTRSFSITSDSDYSLTNDPWL